MKREAYAAARTVSPTLHAYFARHRVEAIRRGQEHLAPLPDAETIEAVIDAHCLLGLCQKEDSTVLRCHYLEGYAVREIPSVDGGTEAAAKSRLKKARRAARQALSDPRT